MSSLRPAFLSGALTPVREESESSKQPSLRGTPHGGRFTEMLRADPPAAANTIDNGRSHATSARSNAANGGPNPLSLGNGSANDSRPAVGDNSTVMASPTVPEEKKHEKKKYDKYRTYTYMAATMSTAIEAYAIILPAILELFFMFTLNTAGEGPVYNITLIQRIFLSLSIFLGIPIGSIAATQLSRRYNEKFVACGFTGLIFLGGLSTTLAGTGLSVPFIPAFISFHVITGIGVGGCRAVNALSSVR
ncbi:hypothetical protein ABW21_db0206040 [Orbilia brochopaga]|nr:hypothetical protein ABW21_db0206040 [Drechslerella brochopaga]